MDAPDDPKALATRDAAAQGLDPYEREYMAGQGAVLFHGKRPAPKWMQLLTAAVPLGSMAVLFTPAWIMGLLFVPLGLVLWALFAVLRFTVSERAVTIQYGLFGPTIPIAAIETAEAIDYDWTRFGGFGIRRSRDGEWMYNMPGDQGRAMRIVWRDAKGNRRVTSVGTPHPEPAVEAIGKAMRAMPPCPPVAGELPSSD